jgi:hypothetical protein
MDKIYFKILMIFTEIGSNLLANRYLFCIKIGDHYQNPFIKLLARVRWHDN